METMPLVEVTRSGYVESRHRGTIVVVQDGKIVDSIGDPQMVVSERSTAKPFQLLPLLNNGGLEQFKLKFNEIAIMVSSHNGETGHVATVRDILSKGGFSENDLKCGTHPPFHFWITEKIFEETGSGPQSIHNNCSGKHAGKL